VVARRVAWVAYFGAIVVGYWFIISAGLWTRWPFTMAYLDTQAEGFRAGHLYTTVPTPPMLPKLEHPLDPANMRYWRWDYSYNQGHIYTYWGLAPAALLAAAKSIFGVHHTVDDNVPVFVFLVVRLLFGVLLIRAMAARHTPRPPGWSVVLAVAVFAIVNPTGFLLGRAAIYEAAITGGSCFLIVALYAGFRAIWSSGERAANRWLLVASLALGLAGTCRVSLFPVGAALLGMLAGVPLLEPSPPAEQRRRALARAPWAALPFTAVTLVHLYLNYVRFQSWIDFGQRHQMGKPLTMGGKFVPANLWAYLIRRLDFSCKFPYVTSQWHEQGHIPMRDHLPTWLTIPAEYHAGEPTAGILVAGPFLLLALVLLVPRLSWAAGGSIGGAASRRPWRWTLVLFAVAALGAALPDLFGSGSTMRYEGDFAPAISLLAIVGGWRLLAAPAGRAGRTAAAVAVAALGVVTIVFGVLLGTTSYFGIMAGNNPSLFQRLAKLQLCGV
jgi:hypothetical protein